MTMARRLMRRAEVIRRDMEGMDNMEGTWITFKVSLIKRSYKQQRFR